MASASESPADAQPGNSGNTADQRLAAGSNSTTARNFIHQKHIESRSAQQARVANDADIASAATFQERKDLSRVVTAWERLSPPLKAAILAIVDTVEAARDVSEDPLRSA